MEETAYDKVTQASLNGIYVKACELDRGHNDAPAPSFLPPGAWGSADAEAHASTHASDAETGASAHPASIAEADAEALLLDRHRAASGEILRLRRFAATRMTGE